MNPDFHASRFIAISAAKDTDHYWTWKNLDCCFNGQWQLCLLLEVEEHFNTEMDNDAGLNNQTVIAFIKKKKKLKYACAHN